MGGRACLNERFGDLPCVRCALLEVPYLRRREPERCLNGTYQAGPDRQYHDGQRGPDECRKCGGPTEAFHFERTHFIHEVRDT